MQYEIQENDGWHFLSKHREMTAHSTEAWEFPKPNANTCFREIFTKHFIFQKYGVIIKRPNKFHKNDSNSSQGVTIPFFTHNNHVNWQKRRFRQVIV